MKTLKPKEMANLTRETTKMVVEKTLSGFTEEQLRRIHVCNRSFMLRYVEDPLPDFVAMPQNEVVKQSQNNQADV